MLPSILPPKMPKTGESSSGSPPVSPSLNVNASKPLEIGGQILTDSLKDAFARGRFTTGVNVPMAAYGGGEDVIPSNKSSTEKLPPILSPIGLSASGYPDPMILTPSRRALDRLV
jgi:hypothetical protein